MQRNEHKLSAHDENNLPTYKTNPPLRENPPEDWIECPTCDGYHPADYMGDCRNDSTRWPSKITAGE